MSSRELQNLFATTGWESLRGTAGSSRRTKANAVNYTDYAGETIQASDVGAIPESKKRKRVPAKQLFPQPDTEMVPPVVINEENGQEDVPVLPGVEIYAQTGSENHVSSAHVSDLPIILSPPVSESLPEQQHGTLQAQKLEVANNAAVKSKAFPKRPKLAIRAVPTARTHKLSAQRTSKRQAQRPSKLPTPSDTESNPSLSEERTKIQNEILLGDVSLPSEHPTPFTSRGDERKGEQAGRTIFTFPASSLDGVPKCEVSMEELHKLSELLLVSGCRSPKPEPAGQPLVWSDSRRELCEALPYYNAYKGGGYTLDGIAHSFMFDGTGGDREYLDSSVVIARAGGSMGKDDKSGKMMLIKNQEHGSQIKALHRNVAEYRPVGVIAGGSHAGIHSKMPHAYQFLDWFKPTDVWCEKSGKFIIVRYRFEKLVTGRLSWWSPKNECEELSDFVQIKDSLVPMQQNCQRCTKTSLQVYLNGWMCLQPDCNNFWQLVDHAMSPPIEEELRFDPRFLKRRTPWPHNSAPWDTRPNPFQFSATGSSGATFLEDFGELTKSIVCRKCGRCTAAKFWTQWVCGSASCDFKAPLPRIHLPKTALRELRHPISTDYAFSQDKYEPEVTLKVEFAGNYRVHKYTLAGVPGFVAHMIANRTVVEEAGGPDDMYIDLQENDIGLERRAKDDKRISGENLCDHYTLNYGMPYKFVASPDSLPFANAPSSVQIARSQLNWAIKALGLDDHLEFNELMVFGYKAANKIGYHDDGEDGLGPTVATLSVGCPAEMKMKMQEKHFRGFTGTGNTKHFTDKLPPIPGSIKFMERKEAYEQLKTMEKTDRQAYLAKKKALPHELDLLAKGIPKSAPEILKMRLAHGDIVVMHGHLIQSYFLHCVEPHGTLRFAFTCRNILPEHLKEDELLEYKAEPDVLGYDGFKLPLPGI